MIKKIKQSFSEKLLLIFVIFLGISSVTSFFLIKNKCLFVEQYNPEDRLTDNQCVGTATPKVVLDIWKDLTTNYGYECIGREETMTSGDDPQPISKVVLKKNIQGVIIRRLCLLKDYQNL